MHSVQVGMYTHRGPARDLNEDLAGYRVPGSGSDETARGALFVVADGMGGHQAGEVASRTAVETVIREYYADSEPQPGERLVRAAKAANRAIYDHALLQPAHGGMGTTLVAAALVGLRVYVANVGDSRAYLLTRAGADKPVELSQITVDHSWVAEQVEIGRLTPDEMAGHPQRNLITRALGAHPSVVVDLFTGDLVAGDTLLLCTDGVCGAVPVTTIAQILGALPPQEAAQELVAQAARHGGQDNATALVVHAAAASPSPVPADGERKQKGAGGQEAGTHDDSTNTPTEVSVSPPATLPRLRERAEGLVMAAQRGAERWLARAGVPASRMWWVAAAAAVVVVVCMLGMASLLAQQRAGDVAPEPAPIDDARLSNLSEAEWAQYLGYASAEEMQARHTSGAGQERWPARSFLLLVGKASDWECAATEECTFTLEVGGRLYRIECPRPETDAGLDAQQVRVLAQVVDPQSHSLAATLVERDDNPARRGHDWQPIVGQLPDNERIWVYCIVDDLVEPADQERRSDPDGESRALVYGTWPMTKASGVERHYVYQDGTYRLRGELPLTPVATATLIPTQVPGK